MTLEALASSGEVTGLLIYDTINATPFNNSDPSSSTTSFLLESNVAACNAMNSLGFGYSLSEMLGGFAVPKAETRRHSGTVAGQGKRKRRRRQRSCKNKEEAENQRMTHIAVERNRRRQMNEHLSVLRSLMPESYIQRGDQASIVGGAIDFVKELEQLLQSLEAQKRTLQQQKGKSMRIPSNEPGSTTASSSSNSDDCDSPPFAQFFSYPQYIRRHASQDYPPPENQSALADIEVTLIETHANLRILSPKRPGQLLKMVSGLQSLSLTVLHLNVTTLDSMVLYSLSLKVEDGCNLTTVDEIAAAAHHLLSLIEAEMTALGQ